MHSAWQIDDLRNEIFEYLQPRELAILARTNKALSVSAINALWKTLKTFDSFISCLPKDSRKRPLQTEDLRKLDFYAAKVQNIVLDSSHQQHVIKLPEEFQRRGKLYQVSGGKTWDELWQEVSELRPHTEFLPNLRTLRINVVAEELLFPLVGITGLNLTKVYVKYIHQRRASGVLRPILEQFRDTPKLQYLFIRDGEVDLVPAKLIKQSPLDHLRLDPRVYSHSRHGEVQYKKLPLQAEILQKSTLEHLTIGLSREWHSPQIKNLKGKYLSALKTLWLVLIPFKPEPCVESCIHISNESWTCAVERWGEPRTYSGSKTDCGRRPPSAFFEMLDNPELELLNIKFPLGTTSEMFFQVVLAAGNNCRLRNLAELGYAGGGFCKTCPECQQHPGSGISPEELREAVNILLPLPRLKILRVSVGPNFLDVLDLDMYRSMAAGLPALEKLWLGHGEFTTSSEFGGVTWHELVPLHHVAAFCSMLPGLVEVSIGTINVDRLEECPRKEWTCPQIKKLSVAYYGPAWEKSKLDVLKLSLEIYFPNSDLKQTWFSRTDSHY